jgi:D-glycero-D-manno-heptose 1,7-bisphosphate phosphatase
VPASNTGPVKAVFFDRDGVLVRSVVRAGKPYAPTTLSDFEVLTEAPAAVVQLRALGFLAIAVTNQPDLATGKLGKHELDAMHAILNNRMPLDDILVCPHVDADQCSCRKPKPGLLIDGARRYQLDLAACFMIGDRWRDVEAGRAAGCRTIFIDRAYDEKLTVYPDHVVLDVAEAAELIVRLEVPNAENRT